jgi:hypothetical protein
VRRASRPARRRCAATRCAVVLRRLVGASSVHDLRPQVGSLRASGYTSLRLELARPQHSSRNPGRGARTRAPCGASGV